MASCSITLLLAPVFFSTAVTASAQIFESEEVVTSSADGASCLIAADLDGDGLMDLVGTELAKDQVVWHRQNALGGYDEALVIDPSLDGAWSVRAADFDGDGDTDLVATGNTADEVHYMENRSGLWEITVLTSASNGVSGLEIADLDGDGDMDVMAVSELDNKLAVFQNQGGTFFEQVYVVPSAAAVTAFDGDGDGDQDIYVGSYNADTLYRLKNDGTGHFGKLVALYSGVNGPSSLRGRDLDGDGYLDLLSASRNDSTVAWFRNNGAGEFAPKVVITTSLSTPYLADAADVDGDGDLEVFVAAYNSNTFAWFEGLGGGHFGPQQDLNSGADGARYLSIADVNGDGALDVLGASFNADTFGIFHNKLPLKKPMLESISGLHSLDAGQIVLDGKGLLAATVLVDGAPVVVTSATDVQLTFDLLPVEPGGLLQVTLENQYGPTVWPAALPRYPVLSVQPTAGLGDSVDLLLDNGTEGVWVLAASGAVFSDPASFTALGWYYGLELNGVWLMGTGVFTPGNTQKTVTLPSVTDPALVGTSFYLQAWTAQTLLGYAGFTATGVITVQ